MRWTAALIVSLALLFFGPTTPVAVAENVDSLADGSSIEPGLSVTSTEPVTVGERIRFRSEILGGDIAMQIALPTGFAVSSADHTYPVIFINGAHGYQFFTTLVGMVKHLADRERMPESIVVSLDEMGDIPEIYTHGMWNREKIGGAPDPSSGIRHLRDEVIPYLEENYRANHLRMILGVSGSSLFPIHAFTRAPELFDGLILVAGADMIGMGFDAESTFIDSFEAMWEASPERKARIYVGVADKDVKRRPEYRTNLERLEKQLGRFENLDLKTEIVANADHYAVFLKAVQSALTQSFPDELWSARYRDLVAQPGDALENIDRYYEQLSARYGFQILPRADRWNNVNCLRFMIRHLIGLERAEEAVAVARRRIEYRPQAAASHAGLADALEAAALLPAAIEAQEKAVRLAETSDDDRLKSYRERLEGLRADAAEQGAPGR